MPFQTHPLFKAPENEDAQLWRYMDVTKYLSLISTSSLFFVRVDKLAAMDPFEGYYPSANVELKNSNYDELPKWLIDDLKKQPLIKDVINDREFIKELVKNYKTTQDIVKKSREYTFVNTWHIQNYESAAMWKMYLSGNEGVAVQSTYKSLKNSLSGYDEFEVLIGCVQYINYEYDSIMPFQFLAPFIYKRLSFSYEKELRALIWTPQNGKNNLFDPEKNRFKNYTGLSVSVDLDILIEQIYVSPAAGDWVVDLIKSVSGKYGVLKPVKQSDLASVPFY